jgi:hypothetical protein
MTLTARYQEKWRKRGGRVSLLVSSRYQAERRAPPDSTVSERLLNHWHTGNAALLAPAVTPPVIARALPFSIAPAFVVMEA